MPTPQVLFRRSGIRRGRYGFLCAQAGSPHRQADRSKSSLVLGDNLFVFSNFLAGDDLCKNREAPDFA